jgi:hypothetical protein
VSAPAPKNDERDWTSLVVPFICAVVFTLFYSSVVNAPPVDLVFITPLFVVGAVVWCSVVWGEIAKLRRAPAGGVKNSVTVAQWKKIGGFIGLIILYLLGMEYIGFFVSSFAMLVAGMLWLGVRNIKQMLVISFALVALQYLLFDKVLRIPFPVSPIGLF